MRDKLLLQFVILALWSSSLHGTLSYGQAEGAINNGVNLESICSPPGCIYLALNNTIEHPHDSIPQWFMGNVEFAYKSIGNYLVTCDLEINGKDLGVILDLEVDFFDENDNLLKTISTGVFEFYAEPGHAEPITIAGKLPENIADKIQFMNIHVKNSRLVPYYQIDSDCYSPCKNDILNKKIKEFKKAK